MCGIPHQVAGDAGRCFKLQDVRDHPYFLRNETLWQQHVFLDTLAKHGVKHLRWLPLITIGAVLNPMVSIEHPTPLHTQQAP